MTHMERIGVRELRREASAILRRVSAGQAVEVTDRGRPVAMLVRAMPDGIGRLEAEGMLRRAQGDLLELSPICSRPGEALPSELVADGRSE